MQRRPLRFTDLDAAIAECRRLRSSGYQQAGQWTLGQICRHLRLTQDPSIEGYPLWMSFFMPIRPLVRWLLLPKILRGDSPSGIRTSSIFVPPENLDDETELLAFAESVKRFQNHNGPFYPHPGFGRLDKQQLELLHAAHASHHLSFLSVATTPKDS